MQGHEQGICQHYEVGGQEDRREIWAVEANQHACWTGQERPLQDGTELTSPRLVLRSFRRRRSNNWNPRVQRPPNSSHISPRPSSSDPEQARRKNPKPADDEMGQNEGEESEVAVAEEEQDSEQAVIIILK